MPLIGGWSLGPIRELLSFLKHQDLLPCPRSSLRALTGRPPPRLAGRPGSFGRRCLCNTWGSQTAPPLAKWVFPLQLDLSVLGKPLQSSGPLRSQGEASLPRAGPPTPRRGPGGHEVNGYSEDGHYAHPMKGNGRQRGSTKPASTLGEEGGQSREGGRRQLSFHPELGEGKKTLQEFIPWNPAKPSAPCRLKLWCQQENLRVKQLGELPSPLLF